MEIDTNARMGAIARQVVEAASPNLAHAAARSGSATEFRARRKYTEAYGAFINNMLDVADLSPAFRERLTDFCKRVQDMAPTMAEWNAAMARQAGPSSGKV